MHTIYKDVAPHIGAVYGLVIGDYLKYLRIGRNFEHEKRMLNKITENIQKRNLIEMRYVPPKFTYPLIINAVLEEDDYLQDIWCQLITNALDSDFNLEIRFAYIDILKSLTSLDAKVLRFAYDEVSRKISLPHDKPINIYKAKMIVDLKKINKCLDVSEEELTISYNNLIRVQCLKLVSSLNPLYVKEGERMSLMLGDPMHVTLTPLGIAFIEACMEEKE